MDKASKFRIGINLKKADGVIVSLGSDMSASILITLYLEELGIKEVTVKALNAEADLIILELTSHVRYFLDISAHYLTLCFTRIILNYYNNLNKHEVNALQGQKRSLRFAL